MKENHQSEKNLTEIKECTSSLAETMRQSCGAMTSSQITKTKETCIQQGPGKTMYIVSARFRYGNGYIWQAILT